MEKKHTIIIDQDDDSKDIGTATIYRAVETWLDGDNGFRYKIKSINEIVNVQDDDCNKCKAVLKLVHDHGSTEGAHHKQWVIDQIVRAILGDKYDAWVHGYEHEEEDEDGNPEYEWDVGVAP